MAKRILVIDDEPGILKAVSIRMKAAGYEVFTGASGEEALKLVKELKPDLMILDVMMPPPNGYQVCRTIKDDDELKGLPIILLTAKGTESDKFWGQESDADAYVTKPYNAEDIMKQVGDLLS